MKRTAAIIASLAWVVATGLGGGTAGAQALSGMSVASLSPAAAAAQARAMPGMSSSSAGHGDGPSADVVRRLLSSYSLAAPLADSTREALDNSLRLGDLHAVRLRDAAPARDPFTLRTSGTDRESTVFRRLVGARRGTRR